MHSVREFGKCSVETLVHRTECILHHYDKSCLWRQGLHD